MAPAIIAAIISAASSLFGRIASSKSKKKSNADMLSAIGSSVANLATAIGSSKAQQKLLSDQNAFNAAEAQKAREWNLAMDASKYQRTVTDMKAAGVNPALAMDGHLSTQATSNAVAQQPDSGMNAIASLASIFSNAELKNKEIALKNKEIDQNKILKNRELDIAQQNANTQEGVGSATAENQKAMAEATRIANQYAAEKYRLANDLMKHQIDYQKYLAEITRIDSEIRAATKDDEIAIKAQTLVNLQTMQSVYEAQIGELTARAGKEWSEKDYTDANKDLLELVKSSQSMKNTYDAYCLEYNLPADEPLISMTYRYAQMNEQYWMQQGDNEEAEYFRQLKAQVREMCNKAASGKMTDAEKTRFWVKEVRGAISDVGKGVGFYIGAKNGAKISKAADVRRKQEEIARNWNGGR